MPRSKDVFSRMENGHFDAVRDLDAKCNDTQFPARMLRAAIKGDPSRAFVLTDSGRLLGFIVITIKASSSILVIERIAGDMAASNGRAYDTLLSGVYYITQGMFGEADCESIIVQVPAGNLSLRGKLIQHGFAVGSTRGSGEKKRITFHKLMVESTWHEGTHYPMGDMVIQEVLNGDCRVLSS